MYEDKKKYVTDLFWSLIDHTMVERIEPSQCPAAPDVHHSFDYPVRRWNNPPLPEVEGEDPLEKEIGEQLEDMIHEVREQFRDKIATLRARVTKPESDDGHVYHVYLIASLGDIK